MYDLVIENARVIDVHTGKIIRRNIAVKWGWVVDLTTEKVKAKRRVDAKGMYACPSLIDSHIHIESSMLTPAEFAKEVAPFGTGAIIADPHEVANVLGVPGVELMIEEVKDLPVAVYFGMPSCVPATPLETSGATLDSETIQKALGLSHVVALGEVMNFPGVLSEDADIIRKIYHARKRRMRVEGHCPGLSGQPLSKYIVAGAESDHESVDAKEAIEKLEKGMHLLIREGSAAQNMGDILPKLPKESLRRCMFASDDKHASDLAHGHIDALVRKAIKLGIEPIEAIRMATLNAAEYFRLQKHGSISPGKHANIILLKSLKKFEISKVFLKGKLVDTKDFKRVKYPPTVTHSVQIPPLKQIAKRITVEAHGKKVRAIGVVEHELVTESLSVKYPIAKDVQKIVVVERHGKNGNVSVGYIKGFGLKKGALGTTVAHDSHNVLVVGTNDKDILKAIKELQKIQGGLVVVDKNVKASCPLKFAGLMSVKSRKQVEKEIEKVEKEAKKLGCLLDSPFMTLSFMALPVIPKLKITDKGLVEDFQFVELFVE